MIPGSSKPKRPTGLAAPLEVAGPILTVATAFSLIRVFEGDSWVVPVFVGATASHLPALLIRRIGWGMPVSALASAVGLILAVTWTHYWDTTFWGLPANDTQAALADDVEQAWTAFGELSPPVEPVNGFTVSAMAAIWLLAFFNDWAAQRLRALYEPMVLPIVAFGFVGLVGDDKHQALTIAVFTASLLLFATINRVAAQDIDASWLGGQSRASSGRRATLGGCAAIAAVALAGAVFAGPVLGSSEDPLVDLKEAVERGRRSSGRVVISPLVDIRGRLVSQADTVMFTVKSEERAFWRLTSLDQFDGLVWTSRADYAARPTQLPSLFQSGSSVEPSVQHFSIEQLGAVWLPAAFEPRSVVSATTDISYEPSSSTLIVGRSLNDSDGISYTVSSAIPRFDPEELSSIPPDAPTGLPVDSYTSLPSDFSPAVQDLAAQLSTGAESGYEQALALQSFFRNGSFVYDPYVVPGHSGNRIEDFLSTRRGYCEQFAGTFAAMARSLGLPARVAVGFTVGEPDPIEPDVYVVRGRHAHAWPEVFLEGVGWVAFEPTPGRGAPGALNYTGIAESQALTGADPPPDEALDADTGAGLGALDDFESFVPPEFQDFGDAQPASGGDRDGGITWNTWAVILGPSALVIFILLIPWFKFVRNQRRLEKTIGNRGKIRLLWTQTVESLALINMNPRPDETYAEFARRAIEQVPLHSPDLRQLGELAAAATFAPSDPTDHNQWLARTWSLSVRSEVDFRVSRRQKLKAAFDPRPLVGSRWQKRRGPSWNI